MAQLNHTSRLVETEEALTVLFCLLDDAYAHLNPRARCYESIKRLSDSEVGTHRPRPLPAAARRGGKRTLFLARGPKVLLSLVPRGGGAASFLLPSAGEEAQAFFGTPAEGRPLGDGRQPGDAAPRLYVAFGFAPQAGLSGLGLLRGGVGEVGVLQRLRGEGPPPHLRHQWGSSLLRPHPCQHRRRLLERGASRRGGFGGWSSEEALGGFGLPKRGVEGGLGRGGHPSADGAIRAAAWGQAASGEIAISSLKRVFGLGETLATTLLVGLATRIAAKIAAYTYAFAVNSTLGRPQGRIN